MEPRHLERVVRQQLQPSHAKVMENLAAETEFTNGPVAAATGRRVFREPIALKLLLHRAARGHVEDDATAFGLDGRDRRAQVVSAIFRR